MHTWYWRDMNEVSSAATDDEMSPQERQYRLGVQFHAFTMESLLSNHMGWDTRRLDALGVSYLYQDLSLIHI